VWTGVTRERLVPAIVPDGDNSSPDAPLGTGPTGRIKSKSNYSVLWISGTLLHVAARENSLLCTEAILSQNNWSNDDSVHVVEVDALATEHRQTALMMAAAHGHVDIVRLLVAAGADINRQTYGCSTALIVACHYGQVDCVHALLGQCLTNTV